MGVAEVQVSTDSIMSLEREPLPAALRELGVGLLREHYSTIDRDRLLSVYGELTASLARTEHGAVVELGCYKGAMSAWMRALLDFCRSTREIHVFDSFEGLPRPSEIDGDHLKEGDVRASREDVLDLHERLELRPPIVHPGWFEDTLGELPDKIAFAYIDADFYESMACALRAVLPRLVPGATVIMDDYADLARNPHAWAEMAGVKKAWDDVTGGRLDLDVILGFGDLAFGVHRAGWDSSLDRRIG
ncbi:TylF/MycF/NovP-related O-methyltransferase [Nocardia abscessus]|uniref:TylF/MycF/NovP-related O-methyltransferase n=1 Tax=Nocardia abscessus TaxID=120957 RepID=UPI002454DD4C|nr:TylF/MycF/NovP-related O-methyltransferase [Nocardia abscessus]